MGNLYLIPCPLGEASKPQTVLAPSVIDTVCQLNLFFVENVRSARRFIKQCGWEGDLDDSHFIVVDKRTDADAYPELLMPLIQGKDAGVISEAGCPGIADPGSQLVEFAHSMKIPVRPLIGPSSILLAMMASGGNSQNFAFNGYLPIQDNDKKKALKALENKVRQGQTQLFMETPYRNHKMIESICRSVGGNLNLTVACDLTLDSETILSYPISQWKSLKYNFHKRPAIFVLS